MEKFWIFGIRLGPFPKLGATSPRVKMISNTGHDFAPHTVNPFGRLLLGMARSPLGNKARLGSCLSLGGAYALNSIQSRPNEFRIIPTPSSWYGGDARPATEIVE